MTTIHHSLQASSVPTANRLVRWLVGGIAIALLLYVVWSLCCVGCGLFTLPAGQA